MPPETFRFPFGDFACLVLADRNRIIEEADIIRIFARDPEPMLIAYRQRGEPFEMGTNILLVEAAGKRLLIDTGHGHDNPANPGHLLANLQAENIAPDSIHTIIISHFHLDHIGGLLDADGNPVFTTARLVVPKQEHVFWLDDHALHDPAVIQLLGRVLAAYGPRLSLLDDNAEIEPGIRYVPAPGHTPGQCMVRIESQGAQLLHVADTIHMALQLNNVTAVPRYDLDAEMAITTRRTFVHRAEVENPLILGFHFPFPGVGHIQRAADQLVWVPGIYSNCQAA